MPSFGLFKNIYIFLLKLPLLKKSSKIQIITNWRQTKTAAAPSIYFQSLIRFH
jgi:hypothetical protein